MHFPSANKLFQTGLMQRASLFFCLVFSLCVNAQESREYQPQIGVTGTVTSVGSETMSNLIALWAAGFNEQYPHVKFQLQTSGSSTAPPALAEGTANIGPMSRALKMSERNYFIQKHGYEPLQIPVALDAITLFVDVNNPVDKLTRKQVDAIFSATRFCGANRSVTRWTELNDNATNQGSIVLFGRNAVSGTYGLFKKYALCDGDFRAKVKELPSSASVVQSVAFSESALGYAGYGFLGAGVKSLAISVDGEQFVAPTAANISEGAYPFSRTLYLLVNKKPGEPLEKLVKEFVLFILSKQGSQILSGEGYVPVSDEQKRMIFRNLNAASRS